MATAQAAPAKLLAGFSPECSSPTISGEPAECAPSRNSRHIFQATQASSSGSVKALEIRRAADEVCKPQFNGWSPAYVRCYVDELNKHPADEIASAELQLPSAAQYRYSFVSPAWSPDFAGWSIVICFGLMFIIVIRMISMVILRILLKYHYREI